MKFQAWVWDRHCNHEQKRRHQDKRWSAWEEGDYTLENVELELLVSHPHKYTKPIHNRWRFTRLRQSIVVDDSQEGEREIKGQVLGVTDTCWTRWRQDKVEVSEEWSKKQNKKIISVNIIHILRKNNINKDKIGFMCSE